MYDIQPVAAPDFFSCWCYGGTELSADGAEGAASFAVLCPRFNLLTGGGGGGGGGGGLYRRDALC